MDQRTNQRHGLSFADAILAIQAATSDLLHSDERAKAICKSVRAKFRCDFVAIQVAELTHQIVQTIYASGLKGDWYTVASHSLEVPKEFRDIQAHVSVTWPPVIEVVEGWHPRFDKFIYDKYGHKDYARAFVPLLIARDDQGELIQGTLTDFDIEEHGDERHRVIRLLPRTRSPYVTIGTLEAGFDNASRPGAPAHIGSDLARALIGESFAHAFLLLPSTLWNVLQVIADSARRIAGNTHAGITLPDKVSYPYKVWSRLPSAPDRVAALKLPIPSDRRPGEALARDAKPHAMGRLFIEFPAERVITPDERSEFDQFIQHAVNAVLHATYYVNSLHLARQLGNLHDIAKALAHEPEAQDLLATVAGHALNVLAADLVSIYRFQDNEFRGKAMVGMHSSEPFSQGVPPISLIDRLRKSHGVIYAENPEDLERLYGTDDTTTRFVRKEKIKAAVVSLLRVSKSDVVGVMIVNFRRPHPFSAKGESSDEQKSVEPPRKKAPKSIETVASTAAIAIRTKQLLSQRETDVNTLVHDLKGLLLGVARTASSLKERTDYLAIQSDLIRTVCEVIHRTFGADDEEGPDYDEKTDIDVAQLADQLWSVLMEAYSHREVQLSAEAVPAISWYRDVLVYVLYALLENAAKYADRESTVKLAWSTAAGILRISVTSTGLPIGSHEREKICGKFYRGDAARKEKKKGVGLGLYIASTLLNKHGGSLAVGETDGPRSTFHLTIPVVLDTTASRLRGEERSWEGNTS